MPLSLDVLTNAIQNSYALEHYFSHLLTYDIHVYDFIGIPLHNTIESDVLMHRDLYSESF